MTILLLAQASALAQPTPSFDVAYVKALPAELHGGDFQVTPTSVSFDRFPLGFMIRWAYGLHPYQAFETAGPNWRRVVYKIQRTFSGTIAKPESFIR